MFIATADLVPELVADVAMPLAAVAVAVLRKDGLLVTGVGAGVVEVVICSKKARRFPKLPL